MESPPANESTRQKATAGPELVKLADVTALRQVAAVRMGIERDQGTPKSAAAVEDLNALRQGYEAVAMAQGTRAQTFGGGAAAWLNEMSRWPRRLVMRVLKDATSPMVARAAAQRIIQAERKGFEGGKEFDRICDRTTGKPAQAVHVTASRSRSPDELLEEARRMAGLSVIGVQSGASIEEGPDRPETASESDEL
jgi:hypothetical protein